MEDEQITDEEVECPRCGNMVDSGDMMEIEEGNEKICWDCYDEEYMDVCEICEERFLKTEGPENYYFILPLCDIKDENLTDYDGNTMKPGIYHAKEFPIFYGSCLSGFDDFYHNNIELIKEIDIELVRKKLNIDNNDIHTEQICDDCKEYYSGKNLAKIRTYSHIWGDNNELIAKTRNLHFDIYTRGVLRNGK